MNKKRVLVMSAILAGLFNLAFAQSSVARFPEKIDCAHVSCGNIAQSFPGLAWSESSSSSNKSGLYVQATDPAETMLFDKAGNKNAVAMKAYSRTDGRDQVWLATAYPVDFEKTVEDFSKDWMPDAFHTAYQCTEREGPGGLMCPVYVDRP